MATASPTASAQSDQFMTLLLAQLENQDPLSPASADEYVSQLSQLTSVENLEKLNTNFEKLLGQQEMGQAASLLGKEALVLDSKQKEVWLTVEQVERGSEGFQAVLTGGKRVALNDIAAYRTAAD